MRRRRQAVGREQTAARGGDGGDHLDIEVDGAGVRDDAAQRQRGHQGQQGKSRQQRDQMAARRIARAVARRRHGDRRQQRQQKRSGIEEGLCLVVRPEGQCVQCRNIHRRRKHRRKLDDQRHAAEHAGHCAGVRTAKLPSGSVTVRGVRTRRIRRNPPAPATAALLPGCRRTERRSRPRPPPRCGCCLPAG